MDASDGWPWSEERPRRPGEDADARRRRIRALIDLEVARLEGRLPRRSTGDSNEVGRRPFRWLGETRDRLYLMEEDVSDEIAYALSRAQLGEAHEPLGGDVYRFVAQRGPRDHWAVYRLPEEWVVEVQAVWWRRFKDHHGIVDDSSRGGSMGGVNPFVGTGRVSAERKLRRARLAGQVNLLTRAAGWGEAARVLEATPAGCSWTPRPPSTATSARARAPASRRLRPTPSRPSS